jgi:thymidine phosphorylase
MQAIVNAQGSRGFDHHHPALGALTLEVPATCDGVVIGIDNLQVAQIARLAGAPKVKGAGVDMMCRLGDAVQAGQVLYRIHAEYPSDLEFARHAVARHCGIALGAAAQIPQVFVES